STGVASLGPLVSSVCGEGSVESRDDRASGLARFSERALPERVADEERPERLDVLRRLHGLPHRLDEMREWMEVAADQPDHEIVVVDVQPLAGETNVVGEVGVAISAPEHAVLTDDGSLLLRREA